MEIWLTHKLRSTFEIEPSKPYFILQSLLLTRNIVSSPLANTCGRNSLSPSKHSIFFCSPSLSTFRTKSCPPPSRKGGWLILYYLSPLLNIGCARHVDEIISNQRQNTQMAGLLAGSVMSKRWLTSVEVGKTLAC